MRGALLLGLRLTGAGAGPARLRTVLVGLAAAIGTALMLGIAAIARAEQIQDPTLYTSVDMQRLLLAVVLTVALPVLVLAATAGRLSAELRDRRLANLRLLGLSPLQTRLVAVVEAAVSAVIGTLAGWLLFLAARPVLATVHVAGRHWSTHALVPSVGDRLWVLVSMPLVIVALAAVPQRLDMTSALERAKRADTRRPSAWRALPLLVGVALCVGVQLTHYPDLEPPAPVLVALFAGILLVGVGLVMVVPVAVRLLADALLRLAPGPTGTVAARRLQAQPAGVTRVVSGLLIGLFLVTGARGVIGAFEATPQYRYPAHELTNGQQLMISARLGGTPAVVNAASHVPGVRHALVLPHVAAGGQRCEALGGCLEAVVATCAQLRLALPDLTGCRDDRPTWIDADRVKRPDSRHRLAWYAMDNRYRPLRAAGVVGRTSVPTSTLHSDWLDPNQLQGEVVLPPSLVDAAKLPPSTATDVLVLGVPGRGLGERVMSGPLGSAEGAFWDFGDYDFVVGLRAIVWAVAAVVLSVGLLAFGVAAVDRAVSRRREVVALQLAGVPARVLRRAQWVEAALPIGVGTVLAIGLGLLAGATYLSLDAEHTSPPVSQSVTLALVSCGCAVVIAGLTVLAASPRIRAELIRAE